MDPRPLLAGAPTSLADLDVQIAGAGRLMGPEEFVAFTHGTSLLVVAAGKVALEWYAPGLGPTDRFLGASMTKSALAVLVGSAIRDGALNLDDVAGKLVPELSGSGYERVTVRHLASMTSGVDWRENHRDPDSLGSRLIQSFQDGSGSSRDLLCMVGPRAEPGTRYEYCTADSQVLDWVRERATGTTFADGMAWLWGELGCTSEAMVALDAAPDCGGVAMAGGGLSAASRDWARIGMLQVDGTVDGVRLLCGDWVDESSAPAARFLEPGRLPSTITTHAGFGYHWWPLDLTGRRVTADGSRGQFTYVDRDRDVVVVKTSQWPYDEPTDRQCRDLSYLALPEIARAAAPLTRETTEPPKGATP
ncbi:MAG: beta-lactamase family protein [Actinomycetota bacterium]|nr:beta-lactamase family protein [Actinomycetota bacterium]